MPARLPQRGRYIPPTNALPPTAPASLRPLPDLPRFLPHCALAVRPINQILIEQAGGARGKPKEFALIGVVGQIMAQQYKLILIQQPQA